MNPHSGEGAPQPQFELPPQPENRPQTGEVQSDNALERNNPSENAVGRQQPPPAATPVLPAAAPADDQADNNDSTATPHHISDDQAKDADIIEKVWIAKAKSIIAQTQEDPFIQKNEMSRVKADYIQKRFNKTIPVDDKQA